MLFEPLPELLGLEILYVTHCAVEGIFESLLVAICVNY